MSDSDYSDMLKSYSRNCIAFRLKVLNRAITSIYDEALKDEGVKVTQLSIMVTVDLRGPLEVKPLCKMMSMDTSTVSRGLARMEKKGWLRSEPSGNGKKLLISITPAGRDLIKKAYPKWQAAQERVKEEFGEEFAGVMVQTGNDYLRANR